jgi:hypothetical protein
MKKVIASGTAKDGKLTLRNRQIFDEEIKGLSGDVTITVAEGRPTRSNEQNAYYHGVVCKMISDFTGDTPDEIHCYYRDKFLSHKKHIVIGSDDLEIEKATTTILSTTEFEEYLEKVRRHASVEINLYVPLPNEPERPFDILDAHLALQKGKLI